MTLMSTEKLNINYNIAKQSMWASGTIFVAKLLEVPS